MWKELSYTILEGLSMTNKKRLFELVKELKQVKKIVDKGIRAAGKYNINYKMWMDYDWGNADNYIFITKNGKKYVFACDSCVFPDVNFHEIVYVEKTLGYKTWKKNGKIYTTTFPGNCYDSEKGYYNDSDDYSYTQRINDKYHVSEIIECQ